MWMWNGWSISPGGSAQSIGPVLDLPFLDRVEQDHLADVAVELLSVDRWRWRAPDVGVESNTTRLGALTSSS